MAFRAVTISPRAGARRIPGGFSIRHSPRRDWLRPLVEMQRALPTAGIVAATWWMLRTRRSTPVATSSRRSIAYADVRRNYPANAVDEPRECEVYIGCGILIKRALFDQVGGIRRALFQGYEDFDLCLKVRERGLKVMYCPGSVSSTSKMFP